MGATYHELATSRMHLKPVRHRLLKSVERDADERRAGTRLAQPYLRSAACKLSLLFGTTTLLPLPSVQELRKVDFRVECSQVTLLSDC